MRKLRFKQAKLLSNIYCCLESQMWLHHKNPKFKSIALSVIQALAQRKLPVVSICLISLLSTSSSYIQHICYSNHTLSAHTCITLPTYHTDIHTHTHTLYTHTVHTLYTHSTLYILTQLADRRLLHINTPHSHQISRTLTFIYTHTTHKTHTYM